MKIIQIILLLIIFIVNIVHILYKKKSNKIYENFNINNKCRSWGDLIKEYEKEGDAKHILTQIEKEEVLQLIRENPDMRDDKTCLLLNGYNEPFCITEENKKKKCELPNSQNYPMEDVQYSLGINKDIGQYPIAKNKNSIDIDNRCVSWDVGKNGKWAQKVNELEKGVYLNEHGQKIMKPSKYAFCSNPDYSLKGNWCYTNKQGAWKYCCPEGKTCHSYTGVTCKRWDETNAGKNMIKKTTISPEWQKIDNATKKNICLNPDNSKGKWCYTDNSGAWEYCDHFGGKDVNDGIKYWGLAKRGAVIPSTNNTPSQEWKSKSENINNLPLNQQLNKYQELYSKVLLELQSYDENIYFK